MNDKLGEDRAALVGKATMPKDQVPQIAKLHNREVRSEGSLEAFFSNYADTDIGLKDHAYIITTITDSCDTVTICILLNQLTNACFLSGAASTDTNTRCLDSQFKESLFQNTTKVQYTIKSLAIDDEYGHRDLLHNILNVLFNVPLLL